jgi:hypothetical protein
VANLLDDSRLRPKLLFATEERNGLGTAQPNHNGVHEYPDRDKRCIASRSRNDKVETPHSFRRHEGASLYIPNDGHPTLDGHLLIANEIASFVRALRLLA